MYNLVLIDCCETSLESLVNGALANEEQSGFLISGLRLALVISHYTHPEEFDPWKEIRSGTYLSLENGTL